MTYIHPHMHTHIHTYTYTYIHIHTRVCRLAKEKKEHTGCHFAFRISYKDKNLKKEDYNLTVCPLIHGE